MNSNVAAFPNQMVAFTIAGDTLSENHLKQEQWLQPSSTATFLSMACSDTSGFDKPYGYERPRIYEILSSLICISYYK